MLIFIKLGGSLITDKRGERVFRAEVAARIAGEIRAALDARPTLRLLIGHGSGSFGHVVAKQYDTMNGVTTAEGWRGYAQVANVAAELNGLMTQTLQDAGVPVLRVQPSASAVARNGEIVSMALRPVQAALEHGLIPLVYGDVALDEVRGGTIISTEAVFTYLAHHLPVTEILELGDTDGVYDANRAVIGQITPATFEQYSAALGGSAGTDVTGGMRTKVEDLLRLVEAIDGLQVRIMSGAQAGALTGVLLSEATAGTVIQAE